MQNSERHLPVIRVSRNTHLKVATLTYCRQDSNTFRLKLIFLGFWVLVLPEFLISVSKLLPELLNTTLVFKGNRDSLRDSHTCYFTDETAEAPRGSLIHSHAMYDLVKMRLGWGIRAHPSMLPGLSILWLISPLFLTPSSLDLLSHFDLCNTYAPACWVPTCTMFPPVSWYIWDLWSGMWLWRVKRLLLTWRIG